MTSFHAQYGIGKTAESGISLWLQSRGWSVVPVYEKAENEYKGPQVFSASRRLVAPDMFVFKGPQVMWVEAKRKSAFTWHRKTGCFVTGIDRHHYHDYLELQKSSTLPLWIMFLQDGGQAKDSPPSPAGLFGNEIGYLSQHIHHEHDNWGRHGMVYWEIDALRRLCKFEDIEPWMMPAHSLVLRRGVS